MEKFIEKIKALKSPKVLCTLLFMYAYYYEIIIHNYVLVIIV